MPTPDISPWVFSLPDSSKFADVLTFPVTALKDAAGTHREYTWITITGLPLLAVSWDKSVHQGLSFLVYETMWWIQLAPPVCGLLNIQETTDSLTSATMLSLHGANTI